MRILLVHNFYRSSAPSGENHVFSVERALLQQRGHCVEVYTRDSDELLMQGDWERAIQACSIPWSRTSAAGLHRKMRHFNPDVVHVHNTFPLLSHSVFRAAKGAARVLTLHNYRLFCAAAVLMRDGKVCTRCLDERSVWPALRYRCYRGSAMATLPVATNIALHRGIGTWRRHVEAFVCLSPLQRDLMCAAGLPAHKVHVKPNFHAGTPGVVHWPQRDPEVVFASRLSAEKGVGTLIRAWRRWGPEAPMLRILGDGELRQELESMAKGLRVEFLGPCSMEETRDRIGRARLVILPSEGVETFGLTIIEGFARGTPAAVSNIGPLPALVRDGESGVVFEPGDPESLYAAVRQAWETPGRLETLGRGARAEFEAKYNEEVNYRILMDIYEQAIEHARGSE